MITEILALKQFSNDELIAFNTAIYLQDSVEKENLGYDKAMKFKLVRDDGTAWNIETLRDALDYVIKQRVNEGRM